MSSENSDWSLFDCIACCTIEVIAVFNKQQVFEFSDKILNQQ